MLRLSHTAKPCRYGKRPYQRIYLNSRPAFRCFSSSTKADTTVPENLSDVLKRSQNEETVLPAPLKSTEEQKQQKQQSSDKQSKQEQEQKQGKQDQHNKQDKEQSDKQQSDDTEKSEGNGRTLLGLLAFGSVPLLFVYFYELYRIHEEKKNGTGPDGKTPPLPLPGIPDSVPQLKVNPAAEPSAEELKQLLEEWTQLEHQLTPQIEASESQVVVSDDHKVPAIPVGQSLEEMRNILQQIEQTLRLRNPNLAENELINQFEEQRQKVEQLFGAKATALDQTLLDERVNEIKEYLSKLSQSLHQEVSTYRSALTEEYEHTVKQQLSRIEQSYNLFVEQEREERNKILQSVQERANIIHSFVAAAHDTDQLSRKVHHLTSIVLQIDEFFQRIDNYNSSPSSSASSVFPADGSFTPVWSNLKSAASEDPLLQVAFKSVPESLQDRGISSIRDLQLGWKNKTWKQAVLAAYSPPGGGIWGEFVGRVFSVFAVPEPALVEGSNDPARLSRASFYINKGQLEDAVRELGQVSPHVREDEYFSEWLQCAQERLVVQQSVRLIKARLMTLSAALN